MRIKCLFIVCAVIFESVKMDDACSEHFKCFSEFIRRFIKSGLKYDIVIKETNNDQEYDSETSVLIIEIPSRKLINTVKQVIGLFELYFDGISDNDDFVENIENNATKKQTTSTDDKKGVQIKEKISDGGNKKVVSDLDGAENEQDKSNEVQIDVLEDYYDFEPDNSTDYSIIDYIELYKDTTNDPVDFLLAVVPSTEQSLSTGVSEIYNSTESETINEHSALDVQKQCYFNGTSKDITRSVFPWIAAIFVKNESIGRFDYVCDGAILSDRRILTAAQCVTRETSRIMPDDLIVILGKRSLLTMRPEEKVMRIDGIHLHDNFTKGHENGNDLAVLGTDESIVFGDGIQPACLATENDTDEFIQDSVEIATTGWAISGELTSIPFDKEKSKLCQKDVISDDSFCANYNNDVRTCPSDGGVFVTRTVADVWRMRGLRTGDQSQTGFCFNYGVFYTDLLRHSRWILSNI